MKIPYESNQRQVMPTGGSAQNIALQSTPGLNPFLDTVVKIAGDKFDESRALDVKKQQLDILKDLNTFNNDTEASLKGIDDPIKYTQEWNNALKNKIELLRETHSPEVIDGMVEPLTRIEMQMANRIYANAQEKQNTILVNDLDKAIAEDLSHENTNLEDTLVDIKLIETELDVLTGNVLDPKGAASRKLEYKKAKITNLSNNFKVESLDTIRNKSHNRDEAEALIPRYVERYKKIQETANKELGINTISKNAVADFSDSLYLALINKEVTSAIRYGKPENIEKLDLINKLSSKAAEKLNKDLQGWIDAAEKQEVENIAPIILDAFSNPDDFLLENGNRDVKKIRERVNEVMTGQFLEDGDKEKQREWDPLDDKQKNDLKGLALTRLNKTLSFLDNQQKAEDENGQRNNDEVSKGLYEKFGNGTLNIADVEKAEFSKDKYGQTEKSNFLVLAENIQTNKIRTSSNFNAMKTIKERIVAPNNKIFSVNTPFTLGNEQIDNPLSILQRLTLDKKDSRALSQNDFEHLKTLLSLRTDQISIDNNDAYTKLLGSLSGTIYDSTNNKDTFGPQRLLQFEMDLLKKFQEGLDNGIPASELINRKSEHYVPRKLDMNEYVKTRQEIQNDFIKRRKEKTSDWNTIISPELSQEVNRPEITPDMIREDGTVKSAQGWLGPISNRQGETMTELSVNYGDVLDGRLIPLLVPTLTKDEIETLQRIKFPGGKIPDGLIPKSIEKKAIEHAIKRDKQGLSPFYESYADWMMRIPQKGDKTAKENQASPEYQKWLNSRPPEAQQ